MTQKTEVNETELALAQSPVMTSDQVNTNIKLQFLGPHKSTWLFSGSAT